ncbi:MAG TPA: replication-associated recombination protein A [Thermoanaerobaculia bacterium]|nr:replication-associated recombination protein A [Thermoanaerobaculia bacterium]
MAESPGDLFDDELPSPGTETASDAPLADRMRPRELSEVAGPPDLVGESSFLARAIAADRVPSLVFWGPPGSGKTTLARIIAAKTKARFLAFSAVTSGIKEIKTVMEEAARARRRGRRTLLFVDEIHRFNRAQQDAFLPFVEAGDIVLVGATTENPSFELNGALLSRLRVVILPAIEEKDLVLLMKRALADPTRGLNALVTVDEDSFEWLGRFADGDARRALTALEAAVAQLLSEANSSSSSSPPVLSVPVLEDLFKRKVLLYDKSGEEHFNIISALHKSLRDSDVDASLYWLARMLEAGEDPLYVARRLVRFASEDVGLADPQALVLAVAAKDAVHFIGMPEGALALSQIAVYLALAPKSNALYVAYGEAASDIREHPNLPPPLAIRNAPTKLMKDAGYGTGYRYAHDLPEKTAGLSCLPDALQGRNYYRPDGEGREKALKERADALRALRARVGKKKE